MSFSPNSFRVARPFSGLMKRDRRLFDGTTTIEALGTRCYRDSMHERHVVSPSYESSDPLVNLRVAIRNECRAEREGDCDPSSPVSSHRARRLTRPSQFPTTSRRNALDR